MKINIELVQFCLLAFMSVKRLDASVFIIVVDDGVNDDGVNDFQWILCDRVMLAYDHDFMAFSQYYRGLLKGDFRVCGRVFLMSTCAVVSKIIIFYKIIHSNL